MRVVLIHTHTFEQVQNQMDLQKKKKHSKFYGVSNSVFGVFYRVNDRSTPRWRLNRVQYCYVIDFRDFFGPKLLFAYAKS